MPQNSMLNRLLTNVGPGESTGQPEPIAGTSAPEGLRNVWQQIGLRVWLDGFLWLTNPDDFLPILAQLGRDTENSTVFARTGLGDFVFWEYDTVYLANMRIGSVDPIEFDPLIVLNFHLADKDYRDRILAHALYREARQRLPQPNYHECYGLVPAMRLGGSGSADSMKLVEMIPHLELLAQI